MRNGRGGREKIAIRVKKKEKKKAFFVLCLGEKKRG